MTFPCTLYRRVHSWCPSTSTCTFLCCAPTTVLLVSTALSPLKQIGNPLGSGKWKFENLFLTMKRELEDQDREKEKNSNF